MFLLRGIKTYCDVFGDFVIFCVWFVFKILYICVGFLLVCLGMWVFDWECWSAFFDVLVCFWYTLQLARCTSASFMGEFLKENFVIHPALDMVGHR